MVHDLLSPQSIMGVALDTEPLLHQVIVHSVLKPFFELCPLVVLSTDIIISSWREMRGLIKFTALAFVKELKHHILHELLEVHRVVCARLKLSIVFIH